MEIILKKDVEGVGFKDDIVTVKNGFGRNFLIPNGSAILATPSAKKVLAENIRQQAVKDKKVIDDANKLAKKISSLEIKIKAKAGEGVKLFGSVNNSNVQKELAENGASEEEQLECYRKVRDEIRLFVETLPDSLNNHSPAV